MHIRRIALVIMLFLADRSPPKTGHNGAGQHLMVSAVRRPSSKWTQINLPLELACLIERIDASHLARSRLSKRC